jgi:asparagine synthase (glutamine-hydrolysing)
MTNVLSHRGPDGKGFHVDKNAGIGQTRLAVIDLLTGDQPMFSPDRKVVIVFNGEIYNYVELKEELKALGHNFTTSSDTEVILAAYAQWGFDCQNKLNGMWAFALWDSREQQLFISRDRIGEKPLHFAVDNETFLFGSEIKSLLTTGRHYEPANHLWHIYLSLGYVPAPHTFYKGISKLMPGHFLVVKDGRVREQAYWTLPSIDERDMRTDSARILEEFENYLANSVKIRMRCDVPYGAFLSGGLDSSSVVAGMAEQSASAVETFTIGFAEKTFDERRQAREVAVRFNTNHHEETVQPETFEESLVKVLRHFDEPFGDASAVPVGRVSQLARQRVTVALTGDGGDEVLSGYTPYLTEKRVGQYLKFPSPVKSVLYRSTELMCSLARNDWRYGLNRARRFLLLADASFEDRFMSKLSMLDRQSIRSLIPGDVPQFTLEDYLSDVFAKCTFTDPFYRLMYFNLKVSLPDDMLAKVDRMSMAHSLETRVPFLDHRLVELTWGVSKNVKLPGKDRKHLLKQTYGKRLPASIVRGPKKSFRVPLREWFKQREFESHLSDLEQNDFGLDNKVIAGIINANNNSEHDYGDFIWRLFVLHKWMKKGTSHNVSPLPAVAA